jgi:hypothetical protein
MHTHYQSENLTKRYHLEDLGIDIEDCEDNIKMDLKGTG